MRSEELRSRKWGIVVCSNPNYGCNVVGICCDWGTSYHHERNDSCEIALKMQRNASFPESGVLVLLSPGQKDWCLPKELRPALVPHVNWDEQLQSLPACLKCFPLTQCFIHQSHAHDAHGAGLSSPFLCCYLRDKQLCVSEHIKSSSKKHMLNSISVLIRQPPLEVWWHSCVLVHVFGYLAIPLSYVMHLLL